MNCIKRRHRAAEAIGGRHGDVDLRRVDVAQIVQVQRRLVGEHSAAARPQRRLHELLQAGRGHDRHPIDAVGDALDAAPPGHLDQAMRIDAVLLGVLRGHVAVLVDGDLGEDVVDAPRHGLGRKRGVLPRFMCQRIASSLIQLVGVDYRRGPDRLIGVGRSRENVSLLVGHPIPRVRRRRCDPSREQSGTRRSSKCGTRNSPPSWYPNVVPTTIFGLGIKIWRGRILALPCGLPRYEVFTFAINRMPMRDCADPLRSDHTLSGARPQRPGAQPVRRSPPPDSPGYQPSARSATSSESASSSAVSSRSRRRLSNQGR